MKLPIPNILPKKEKKEYLLALLLRDEKASSVIFEQIGTAIKVIGQHTEYFKTSLEDAPLDELLDTLDKTISRAEETLPPNIETRKTVFGVKDEWVEDKKIKKEYLMQLKKVSDSLDLEPIGFLVVSEAVAHLIQKEEGAPLSAILAEVGQKSVNLVLFRGGKVVDSKNSPIEESPVATIDSLLKHFTIEVLPSRLIVFNGKEDAALTQKFISHQWSKSLPFLHVPQISVLPEGFDARSIVYGAATQMGLDVLSPIVDTTGNEIKTYEQGQKAKVALEETTATTGVVKDEFSEKLTKPDEGKPALREEETEDEIIKSGDNFGFVQEEDIEKIRPTKETEQNYKHPVRNEETTDEEFETSEDEENSSPLSLVQGLIATGIGLLSHLPKSSKKLLSASRALRGNKMILIPVGVIALLVVLAALYTMNSHATITLTLNPKVAAQEEEVSFSADNVNDFSKHTIAASAVSSTLEGSVNTNATGKKDVGEKAKGTVTIYNNNDSKKTLSAGTVITSGNNLDYTLDKEVSIASQSGDVFTGTKPGTAQAAVTAKNIGTEYNLPSNTKFSVSGASNVAAKNDSAFSGGSKKQVTVVAKKDQDKLLSELPKSLTDKAKDDLGEKVGQDESLLPNFSDITIATKKFDKNVDEEAKTVTLKGKVTFSGLTYKNKDLQDFATSVLKNNFAENLHISDKGVNTELKDAKETDDETVKATVSIKAGLLPTLSTETIQKDLTGKSVDQAKEYLMHLPQVSNSEIHISPPIPFIPQFLPRFTKNITVDVKSNE